ncbi:hypothetical protein LO771_09860 [Streptacidiphilus sp. ASG 303]|uniref:DoxX family protein n=1 Tax=Streptacidiphilus sp. ASG 303 TaxID=2896847 RepID=UPI001E579278|nr:hypothetical protein [Streptacidiphilus sp. ASG 303]MCD0482698.1 hypothetical protein [Streptacidiphilus sp. ASG 303]
MVPVIPGTVRRLRGAASGRRSALLLSGLLAAAGTLHFVRPEPFDALVPRALPGGPRLYTQLSGAAELACAAAVALPRTRRLGGLAAAGLFAVVYPANVKMAYDWRRASPARRAVAYGRLPLQAPLVGWALAVRRGGAAAR